MSRATRPLRRVRGAERATLLDYAAYRTGIFVQEGPPPSWWPALAHAIRCRPSHVRRCLLGRVVSARAAGRILEAAGARR